jgi:hypothetical protein
MIGETIVTLCLYTHCQICFILDGYDTLSAPVSSRYLNPGVLLCEDAVTASCFC